jgi:hypothetical protein
MTTSKLVMTGGNTSRLLRFRLHGSCLAFSHEMGAGMAGPI